MEYLDADICKAENRTKFLKMSKFKGGQVPLLDSIHMLVVISWYSSSFNPHVMRTHTETDSSTSYINP